MKDFPEDLTDNPTIGSLEKLIGPELLARLSEDFGGGRLYIPVKAGPNSPLAVSVGLDACEKIVQIYGGMELEVPLQPGKKARVLAMRGKAPVLQIARELRISRRTIYRIFDAADAQNQLDFFSQE